MAEALFATHAAAAAKRARGDEGRADDASTGAQARTRAQARARAAATAEAEAVSVRFCGANCGCSPGQLLLGQEVDAAMAGRIAAKHVEGPRKRKKTKKPKRTTKRHKTKSKRLKRRKMGAV